VPRKKRKLEKIARRGDINEYIRNEKASVTALLNFMAGTHGGILGEVASDLQREQPSNAGSTPAPAPHGENK
jgi:hypothetical protein